MNATNKPLRLFMGASALAILAAPSLALAQEDMGEEIVVTARQRSEALQDVPAQVTAFNAAAIEARGIERPADFIASVPNVTFVETQNAGTSFLVIRGISQARNSEPSAAIVVDGVPMTQPAQFNQALIDISQIEVLKGPQGALYGRNAIGGAIVITTQRPSDEFEGRAMIGYESGPGFEFQGAVNVPITSNLWARGAVSFFDTEGHLENVNTTDASAEENVDPVENINARLSFLYEPTSNFTADLRLSMDQLDTRALYFTVPDFSNPNFNNPNYTDREIDLNNSGENQRDIYDVALKLTYNTDYGQFLSITGFNSVEEILTGDGYTFDPFGASRIGFDFNQSQFLDVETITQEFRFSSPQDRRFRYITGVQFFSTDRYISTGNMFDAGDEGVQPIYRTPNPQFGLVSFDARSQISFLADSQEQFAYAAYLATSTDLTDQLELSVNVRYDNDTRENTTETPQEFLDANPITGRQAIAATTGQVREETWDDVQPQVILRYAASDNLNLYGSYSRGFRSGGFNQTGVGATATANGFFGVGDQFDAETADTFEIGFKSSLFDNRVTLNGSAYRTIAEGTYFFVFLAANSTQNLGNIDQVEYTGFDLELNARVTDNFRLNAGFGYTDSEITEFPDPVAIGAQAPLVSEYTFNLGAQYTHPLGGGVEAIVRADYNVIGDTYFTIPFSAPGLALDATPVARDPVNLVDLRLGVQSETWSLIAWSKNLLDEEYNAEYSPGGFMFKAQPMRWGIELSRRF
ncbi:MAG: TonB-dependent receptor [Hyphomonadaceae bacterium]|nr:TonB-dependent receptor [Hyphomonadaceae bacterium]